MLQLQAACDASRDFVNLLRSPIVKADKKSAVLNALFGDKLGRLTTAFTNLLIRKGREFFLPEIIREVIRQYQEIKHITKVKITTAVPLEEDQKAAIVSKIRSSSVLENVDLETEIDPSLIGGFVLEANNNLFDASVLRDLKDIKKQFSQNIYIRNIR